MSIKYRKLVGLLVVLAVVCSMVVMAVAPAAAFIAGPCTGSPTWPSLPAAAVTWSAQSAFPGQSIVGSGVGFQPGAAITVTLNGIALTSATTVVAGTETTPYNWGNGTWTGSFKLPNLPAGNYTAALGNGLKAVGGATSSCADWFEVVPKLTSSPAAAAVSETVTLTGYGFSWPGSAGAALFQSNGVTPAGTIITSPMPIVVNSDGTISATFAMPQPIAADPAGNYTIVVTDSSGKKANSTILLIPGIQLIPSSGLPGQNFTVQGSGFLGATTNVVIYWQTPYPGNITPLKTAVLVSGGSFVTSCTIPSGAIVGSYNVWAVAGPPLTPIATGNYAKALMTVGLLGLTLTPASASAGSTVTLQGSGFTQTGAAWLASVVFGGTCAPITGPMRLATPTDTIPASGALVTTIVVPPLNPGTYTVIATDNMNVYRTGTWTVAAPTINLTPSAGPNNTLLGITGSGWIPTTNALNNSITGTVTVQIGGGALLTAPVSGNGRFSLTALVTGLSAGPQTVLVSENGAPFPTSAWGCTLPNVTNFSKVGTFTVTAASMELSPVQGVPGDTVTFTGTGFPAYTQVNTIDFSSPIGTVTLTLVPQPQVNESGNVTGSFNVPASIAGTATVIIWAGGSAGAATFNVMSGAATPAAVLASLITGGQLDLPVWSFNNTTKAWDMYDPNDLPDSHISMFEAGTSYCIHVNETVTLNWGINSYTLTPGWNCIGWLG